MTQRTVFILNGPNLNLLGTRQPEVYGHDTLAEIETRLVTQGAELGFAVECRQTNHEGVLVDWLHEAKASGVHAVLLNAGAYTHTSIALLDAILSTQLKVIEVHLSDPEKREPFRHLSYVGMAAVDCVKGYGPDSYRIALERAAQL